MATPYSPRSARRTWSSGAPLGRGEVFEKGKKVGYATITQLTIGVQIGGDTFDEVVVFESREAFERFKRQDRLRRQRLGRAGQGRGCVGKGFREGRGGLRLPARRHDAGTGHRRPTLQVQARRRGAGRGQAEGRPAGRQVVRQGQGRQGRGQEDEGEEEGQDEGEEGDEEASSSGGGNRAELAGRAVGGVRSTAAKATEMVKRHPVAATVAGVGVVAGLGMLIARAVSGGEEGEADQDSGGEDEGAQDSAEDSDEDQSDEDEDQERDDEDEDTDARAEDEGEEEYEGEDDGSEEDESENRGVLSRLLSRGKSRA